MPSSHLIALTLAEELARGLFTAFAGALFLTLFGYVAADRWGARRERERAEAEQRLQRAREEHEVRTALVETATREAAAMYVACEHAARGVGDRDTLHQAYWRFDAEARALEEVLRARYARRAEVAVVPNPEMAAGGTGDTRLRASPEADPVARWHQVRDLLRLYYYSLLGRFSGGSLERNTMTQERLHSGLTPAVDDPDKPSVSELRDLQEEVRAEYETALRELVDGLVNGPWKAVATDSATEP